MPDIRLVDLITEEQYDVINSRFLETLKDIELPEGTWDGIIDYVLDGYLHPDFVKKPT